MIREIISHMNLTVNFYKVKAHSGNQRNDEVDALATSAHFDNTNLIDLINCGQNKSPSFLNGVIHLLTNIFVILLPIFLVIKASKNGSTFSETQNIDLLGLIGTLLSLF